MVECFGYSRKSPDDRKNTTTSIQNQNDLIKLICNSKKWNLNSVEEDRDISGGDRNRKGIKIQINKAKDFRKNNSDIETYIIVKDSKRFARDSSFFSETLGDLKSCGIKVFSIMKNDFLDNADISDRIISVVDEQIIFDAKKYAEINEDLKKSKKLPYIPAPFGYKYDKNKNWVIIKKDAKIVLGVLSEYASGRDYKATIKDFKIHKGKYYRIIKNAKNGLYSGFIYYERKIKDSNKKIIRVDKVKYEGKHHSILNKELIEKVNGRI